MLLYPSSLTTAIFYAEVYFEKLQSVQNVAARLITFSRKYDHIIPVLFDVHWLPVN